MDALDIFENRDNIVPIIGENCFYYYDESGDKIPFQSFLIDKIIEKRGANYLTSSMIEQMKNKGFHGLSLCRQYLGFARDEEFIKYYKAVIREYKPKIRMDETIEMFLKIYKFHMIVTTNCFDFLERALPWYSTRVYVAANGANNKEEIDPKGYTIYHVLGKADIASTWAWDEESLMYILHCHHNSDYASNGLYQYIFPDQTSTERYKSLLVLYSNLPDWLFRFFLYPLAYKEKWSSGFYLNKTSGSTDELKNFIERVICYDIEETNVEIVLQKANSLLDDNDVIDSDRVEHGMKYDIFLSHANEDAELAKEIKIKLESLYGLKIWLDVKGGIDDGTYSERMRMGIENSAYFMPMMTKSYISKLRNDVCGTDMTIEEILKDDGTMSYVQKEALAANIQWKILHHHYPQRKAYLLPLLFPESHLSFETIRQCVLSLGQLPEMFIEQTVFMYDPKLFVEKKWDRYKTIEKL